MDMTEEWFTNFLSYLPEKNKENLRKRSEENTGIFDPTLYNDREMS